LTTHFPISTNPAKWVRACKTLAASHEGNQARIDRSGTSIRAVIWFYLVNDATSPAFSRRHGYRPHHHGRDMAKQQCVPFATLASQISEGAGSCNDSQPRPLLQNAALLHMVADCARASGAQRLQSVATSYFRKVARPYWFGRMVDPSSRFERPPDRSLLSLDDYQRWFLHAVAPDEYQLSAKDVAAHQKWPSSVRLN
jgi:hypothetical protein